MASTYLYDPLVSTAILDELAAGDQTAATPSKSVKELPRLSKKYRIVEELVENALNHSRHSFKISRIELVVAPTYRSKEFKRRLHEWPTADPRFLFHGTKESNHPSIFDQGFSNDGEHSDGYIGKGVYLSPTPEYSAARTKETPGGTRLNYAEPVSVGTPFKLLGCLVTVGRCKTFVEKSYDTESDISDGYDAHTAWVDEHGRPTGTDDEKFAKVYAIKNTISVYPRFVLNLARVNKETVWLDPNVSNEENSDICNSLKAITGFYFYATSNPSKALDVLKRKKHGTSYRVVTAGRGGEEFIRNLLEVGVASPVMVFCASVRYHKTWAAKFSSVQVTNSDCHMMAFASWSTSVES